MAIELKKQVLTEDEEIVRATVFSILIPRDLYTRFKQLSIDEKIPIKDLANRSIWDFVKKYSLDLEDQKPETPYVGSTAYSLIVTEEVYNLITDICDLSGMSMTDYVTIVLEQRLRERNGNENTNDVPDGSM